MKNHLKILIVRLSAIGDVAHTLPILHALKTKYPDCKIGWAVEDRASDLIVNNPLVDKVFVFPKNKWKKRGFSFENLQEFAVIIGEIREEKFDIAIDVQELLKSGLIAFLSGAKRRIAHAGTREFAEFFVNEKLPARDTFDTEYPVIKRYLEPAAYLGASTEEVKFTLPPVSEATKEKVDGLLAELNQDKEIVIFSPATIWQSKHWLEEYWAKLLDELVGRYNVVFTGVPGDLPLIERITSMANTDDYLNLAGKTSIFELIEVFNRTKYLIAPDTGPAHIANATEKPKIIMIFGSTGVRRTPPYGEQHAALASDLPCQPCFKRICPRKDCPMECMQKITPEMVLEKII